MKKIKSVLEGSSHTIPFRDVLFTEEFTNSQGDRMIRVIFNGTTYNFDHGDYNNSAVLQKQESDKFMTAWLAYRKSIDGEVISGTVESIAATEKPLLVVKTDNKKAVIKRGKSDEYDTLLTTLNGKQTGMMINIELAHWIISELQIYLREH